MRVAFQRPPRQPGRSSRPSLLPIDNGLSESGFTRFSDFNLRNRSAAEVLPADDGNVAVTFGSGASSKVLKMSIRDLLVRFSRDQAGSYAIIFALLLPVLVGIAGLGTEGSLWFMTHRSLQNAADSAAFSGATSGASGSTLFTEAAAVSAAYGFANGVDSVTVTVNRPPTTGNYTT